MSSRKASISTTLPALLWAAAALLVFDSTKGWEKGWTDNPWPGAPCKLSLFWSLSQAFLPDCAETPAGTPVELSGKGKGLRKTQAGLCHPWLVLAVPESSPAAPGQFPCCSGKKGSGCCPWVSGGACEQGTAGIFHPRCMASTQPEGSLSPCPVLP